MVHDSNTSNTVVQDEGISGSLVSMFFLIYNKTSNINSRLHYLFHKASMPRSQKSTLKKKKKILTAFQKNLLKPATCGPSIVYAACPQPSRQVNINRRASV